MVALMPELADLVTALTDADRRTVTMLCFPSVRAISRLLRLRYGAQASGLRNREMLGENGRRLEFARWLADKGAFAEWR